MFCQWFWWCLVGKNKHNVLAGRLHQWRKTVFETANVLVSIKAKQHVQEDHHGIFSTRFTYSYIIIQESSFDRKTASVERTLQVRMTNTLKTERTLWWLIQLSDSEEERKYQITSYFFKRYSSKNVSYFVLTTKYSFQRKKLHKSHKSMFPFRKRKTLISIEFCFSKILKTCETKLNYSTVAYFHLLMKECHISKNYFT